MSAVSNYVLIWPGVDKLIRVKYGVAIVIRIPITKRHGKQNVYFKVQGTGMKHGLQCGSQHFTGMDYTYLPRSKKTNIWNEKQDYID